MTRLLLRRLLWALPTLVGLTALTFVVARLAPGDPLQLSGEELTVPSAARPAPTGAEVVAQYVTWCARLLRGELGTSLLDHRPVAVKLSAALPRTLLVSGAALLLAWAAALPLGVWLAVNARRWRGRVASGLLALLYGLPTFWIAVLALLAFATPRGVEWFPLQGLTSGEPGRDGLGDLLWHLVLPVCCAALPLTALAARLVRAQVLGALASDYVLAARGRGVPEGRVVWAHAVRGVLGPLVAAFGNQLPYVVSGSVVIERVFGIPGMGLLALEAATARDLPTVMAVAVVMAVVTLASLVISDLAQALVDPRVRLEDAA